MSTYDKKVLDCFLKNQLQLFPEEVASTPEEADAFLEEVFAEVVKSKEQVRQYFEETGVDLEAEGGGGIRRGRRPLPDRGRLNPESHTKQQEQRIDRCSFCLYAENSASYLILSFLLP